MTQFSQLVEELRHRYNGAEPRERVTSIHLFGIVFADALAEHSANEIAEQATGHKSYGTEIRKGMRLARYVELKKNA